MLKQWYQSLFDNYGEQYDKECFVQGTAGECDFVEKELGYNKSQKILDVGCGTGRHAIELTKRGYTVTGVDLSEAQLGKAREKARAQNLDIEFCRGDARALPFISRFDAAIMLCEGGFPLMETDEMNFQILKSVTAALKLPCKFIFTTLNGLFPIYHSINDFHGGDKHEEGARYKSEHFDLMTFRDYNITTFVDDNGNEFKLECNERYYIPSEITWMLRTLGYTTIEIFGAKLGAYSRTDKLTTEDYEMLVVAQKKEST